MGRHYLCWMERTFLPFEGHNYRCWWRRNLSSFWWDSLSLWWPVLQLLTEIVRDPAHRMQVNWNLRLSKSALTWLLDCISSNSMRMIWPSQSPIFPVTKHVQLRRVILWGKTSAKVLPHKSSCSITIRALFASPTRTKEETEKHGNVNWIEMVELKRITFQHTKAVPFCCGATQLSSFWGNTTNTTIVAVVETQSLFVQMEATLFTMRT